MDDVDSGRGVSAALGFADTASSAALRLKLFPWFRFFRDGWGNMSDFYESQSKFEEWAKSYHAGTFPLPSVTLEPANGSGVCNIQRGHFETPFANMLPEECSKCTFELITPRSQHTWACMVHFPGTGDQSYAYRRHSLAVPLAKEGVASILVTAPFYGDRRPRAQWMHYVSTVERFAKQSGSLIMEGLTLLDWARSRFPAATLGVTGLSWGGSMTIAVGFHAKKHSLAIVPCLPSASPEVIVTGALRNEIDLKCLAAERPGTDPAEQLREFLRSFGFHDSQRMAASLPDCGGKKAVLQISAAHDTFVPPSHGREAFEHVSTLDSAAELKWISGGHFSSFATARWRMPAEMVRALRRVTPVQPMSRL
eukprot:TRINITY_DN8562_c0_g3_i1.p1 TRINITY_DN8562_c0_g3~~TRINITY_DN8562_c0_g3_i1.p1  ORF type:complete len:366 (-),score=35.69 TRINITY_DN8562_c0_g3_i1:64-1161(-)